MPRNNNNAASGGHSSSSLVTYVVRCTASYVGDWGRAWGSIRGWITRSYAALSAVTRIATAALACLELAHNDVLAERAADQMLARSLRCVGLGHCDGAGWVFPASYKSVMTMLREKHTNAWFKQHRWD